MRYALLLRGINIGGKRIPMADLRALLTELGHTDVRTILASGQAVVTSDRAGHDIAAELEERLASEANLVTAVMVRSGPQLAGIVAANPFPTADGDGSRHAVVFLREPLDAAGRDRLGAGEYAPDEYVVNGREIYLRLPNGFADGSSLSVDVGKLPGKAPATTRNWNTVRKLEALTS